MTQAPLIGVDLGGTKIEAALLGRDHDVVWRRRVPTPQQDYAATLDAVAMLVQSLADETGCDGPVGIATPGSPSPRDERMRNCNSTCLNGQPLLRDLQDVLQRPVRIANDADCLALSEAVDGAGADAHCVFGIILGTGVGGGLVVDRRLLLGPNRISGEWGHNPLPAELAGSEARACYCGRYNCVECWLSGPALAGGHVEAADARELVALAGAGDELAQSLLDDWYERLAAALAIVINIVDPDAVVVGGGLSNITALYEQVPQRWSRYVFSDVIRTGLLPARFGDSSGVRGAARLWAA